MSQYTTGEVAKLCGISVRTVQFYDTKQLLNPSALTEGGRRLYSEADLQTMRLICTLKSLGLSLASIKGILDSDKPQKILLLLLQEQEKEIEETLSQAKQQLQVIRQVKKSVLGADTIPVQSIIDIEKKMKEKRRLRRLYTIMLTVGIVMDIIEIAALVLWIIKGIWQPFAIVLPVVIVLAGMLVRMYHRTAAYICPECNAVFQPEMKEFFFSKHTLKTRKLTCPNCGSKSFCVETVSENLTD